MSVRELVVLGTASQAPTRHRNHNGYLLRFDGAAVLFDPGEGTQRQAIVAGVSLADVTAIFVSHFHGDHCLGLPGVIQRLSLDRVGHAVDVAYPRSGQAYLDRLRHASIYDERTELRYVPLAGGGPVTFPHGALEVTARPLCHRVEAWGFRLEEPPSRSFVVERLDALGVRGPQVGELAREGSVRVDGRTVQVDEVSVPRRGQVVAFVMDTKVCDDAVELARDADLLVCESTFVDDEADLAERYGHLTARQAATIAREAGADRLVLAHFSQRHPDEQVYVDEAAAVHPNVVAAREGLRVPLPRRRARERPRG
jgi:ribonuclease Z